MLTRRQLLALAAASVVTACTRRPDDRVVGEPPQRSTVVDGARIFDGEALLDGGQVLIRGQTIAEVGDTVDVPESAEIVDARGRTLLPGLIDAHTHVEKPSDLVQALLFGVTTELDMAMRPSLAATLRRQQRRGAVHDRADLFSAGYQATAPDGHGTQYYRTLPTLRSVEEVEPWVAERVREGSDYIKVTVEDCCGFNPLDLDVAAALIEAAHVHERLAVVHIRRAWQADAMVEAGADGLAHVMRDGDRPSADLIEELTRRNGFVVPTLLVLAGDLGQPEVMFGDDVDRWLRDEDREHRDGRHHSADPGLDAVGDLHAGGVRLLAGADPPNPSILHGASLHGELQLMVAAGLAPADALKAATAAPADAFGLRDRGRIAAGMRADLLLVNGDPTHDIGATAAIERIWKAGAAVERPALFNTLG